MKILKNPQNSGHPISHTQISIFFLLNQTICFSCLVEKWRLIPV